MPQTLSGCACSSTGSKNATKEIIPGLTDADLSAIEITQGVDYQWRQCFVKQTKPFQIFEEQIGGKVIISADDARCFAVGDKFRLINYNACQPDTDDSSSVFTIGSITANPANAAQSVIVGTGLTTIDKVYVRSAITAVGETYYGPIGCAAGAVTEADAQPPFLMQVCDGSPILLSGGITARDDYFQSFAVLATAGSDVLVSMELGMAQPGDYITAPGIGFPTPVKVLRVDQETVQNTVTGSRVKRDRITVATAATTSSNCAEIKVTRGMIVALDIRADGDCWEITVPGYATAALQLHKSMKKGDNYQLGTLTIVGYYGKLDANGNLIRRSFELMRSQVTLKPSHVGV